MTAQFDVGLEGDGVVCLDQRVDQLVHADRLVALVAGAKILSFHHPRQGVAAGQLDDAARAQLVQPATVVVDHRGLSIEDLEDLPGVSLHVRLDLPEGQLWPGGVATGGVADQAGEIADQEDHAVAELLEVAHLAQQHGVAEMQIGCRRVEAGLDRQRFAGDAGPLQLGAQLVLVDQVDGTALQQFELLGNRRKPAHDAARSIPVEEGPLSSRPAARVGRRPPAASGPRQQREHRRQG